MVKYVVLLSIVDLKALIFKHIRRKEINGGGGGIRTHGRLSPTSVFKTGAFNHSATPPTESEYWVSEILSRG